MTKVTLCCVQPVLVAGFQVILDRLDGFTGSVCLNAAHLADHIAGEQPHVVLFETTSHIDLDTLRRLVGQARNAAVVLWTDGIPAEFAAQAISLGVRGLLRKSLPLEVQARCLERVAAGEIWVEETLGNRLLSTNRIALTVRERQLVALVAEGLKNREIARRLEVTQGTVKVYLCRLFKKTGVSDRLELALFALKNLFVQQTGQIGAKVPAQGAGAEAEGAAACLPMAAFIPSFICVERARSGSA